MNPVERAERYPRFGLLARIEHWLLVATFVTLAATGLPQMFADTTIGAAILSWLGGIDRAQAVHRLAAAIFAAGTALHLGELTYKLIGRRFRWAMLPGWQDLRDFLTEMAYHFGRAPARPRFGRYGYAEKAEYWSLIWGAVVMSFTGILLWDPPRLEALLPPVVLPVARAVHGYEALLAVLAVATWHVYHVHIRHFNRAMFRGWLSRHEMELYHPLELAQAPATASNTPPAVSASRRRWLPVAWSPITVIAGLVAAIVVVVLGGAAAWWLGGAGLAVETTEAAIPEPRELASPAEWGPVVPHPVEDRPQCLSCHGVHGLVGGPEFIREVPASTCGSCHRQ